MLSSFAGVLLFMLVGIVFIIITLLIARLVRPKGKYSPDKYMPYECLPHLVGTGAELPHVD